MLTAAQRERLQKDNQALMARRARDQAGQPAPISKPVAAIATGEISEAERMYWEAIRSGKPTGSESYQLLCPREKWDAFNDEYHPALPAAIKTIKRWYNERLPQGGAIMLAGGYGCGKTHLAEAIHELYGFRSLFWNETEFFKTIQRTYNKGTRQTEGEILDRLVRADLLVYDDLGDYKARDDNSLAWIQNIYRYIFNSRCDRDRAVFFTTNLAMTARDGNDDAWSPLEERIGPRNFSRLLGALDKAEYYVDLFAVSDYRMRNFLEAK
jgi:DNA replication protein DnaC